MTAAPASQTAAAPAPLESEVAKQADFDHVRYAQSWEDPGCLAGALQPGPGSTVLSIAAAGDNSFALLLQGHERVISVDMSPAQCALVELKRAAILELDARRAAALRRVARADGSRARRLYARIRPGLPAVRPRVLGRTPRARRAGRHPRRQARGHVPHLPHARAPAAALAAHQARRVRGPHARGARGLLERALEQPALARRRCARSSPSA